MCVEDYRVEWLLLMIEHMRHYDDPRGKISTDTLLEGLDDGVCRRLRRSRGAAELSIGILLWPRFPLLSLSGLVDSLRHAADIGDQSRPIRCQWTLLGGPGQRCVSSCGLDVPVEGELSDPGQFDYVVVIGGLLEFIDAVPNTYPAFLHQAAACVPLIGLCTGSFVLAQYGLMEGRTACVHPYHRADWRRLFPKLHYISNSDFLVDKDRITCSGGVSVIELAIHLISQHCGPDRAGKVIYQMTVAKSKTGSLIDKRKALGYASFSNRHIHKAVMLMEKFMGAPLDIGVIAGEIGVSKRQLERLFVSETTSTPSQFYRQIRLRYSRWLLVSSDLKLDEIAFNCGFADAPHFIRQFKQMFGLSPGKLRNQLKEIGVVE